ncbi:hypothetical protein DFH07DRAFT_695136, partial [Mycena maculata]
ARAAAGIFIGVGDDQNKGMCIPSTEIQSQYIAELYAALAAIKMMNSETALTIISTQSYVLNTMNKKLSRWEHEGWVGVPHREVLRCLSAELKARKAVMVFKLAPPGSHERMLCRHTSELAKRAARMRNDEQWELTLPPGTALPGLSLQGNKQRVFYHSIREIKTARQVQVPRHSTARVLDIIQEEAAGSFGRHVTEAEIWKALSAKEFLPRTTQFLWKAVHNAHRIGKYWTHIPECEEWAVCGGCGDVIKDMDHILLKCASPGQEIIRKAAEALWREKEDDWRTLSLGVILGCDSQCFSGLAEFRDDKGKTKEGSRRLYWIIMSESVYTIWKLRNDRRISRNRTPASDEEIINKWKYSINQRLQADIILANRPLKGRRPALAPQLVIATWSGILDDERNLPANWLREPRVLVGSRA